MALQRFRRAAVIVGILVGALGVTATSASAAGPTASTERSVTSIPGTAAVAPRIPTNFRIHNWLADGKCIGISNNWAGSWNCTTNPDQTWHFGDENFPGYRQLKNGNGQCLGVDSSSTTQGARIRGWTCNGHPDQYWSSILTPVSGYIYLINYWSRLVVGVYGSSTANGAELVQWGQNHNGDQYWSLF